MALLNRPPTLPNRLVVVMLGDCVISVVSSCSKYIDKNANLPLIVSSLIPLMLNLCDVLSL